MNFNLPYNREEYVKFFRDQFLPEDFLQSSESISPGFIAQYTRQVMKIGRSNSLDLNVYEVRHASENDPRVSLSKESFKLLAEYGQSRALVLFISDTLSNYRLSLVTIDLKWEEGKRVQKEYSNPRRLSFFLGHDAKVHTPQEYLAKPGRVKDFEDLKKRFSIEVVNKDFFTEIAILFSKLTGGERTVHSRRYDFGEGILDFPSTDKNVRKEFAVRLIGRLVFCWFLKKKCSKLNVPLLPEELLSTDAIDKNKGYYHKILEPLFFQVLNTPVDERAKTFISKPWSIIPFLNGGLFTPHDDDHYTPDDFQGISPRGDLKVPDDWLLKLLKLFETYNFTIDENTPVDVELSIEPEMLGRIFENLLAEINPDTGETARKATGSYYTPRPIVEYMVDESVKQYLLTKTKLPEEKISALLSYAQEAPDLTDAQKDEVLNALDTIKVIDPACGSGAFPMGILQKILLILQKIDPDSKKWLSKILAKIENSTVRKEFEKKLKDENWNYVHKLGIIQSSIYGVDIQPIAVEISKLRCFLSLIVDQKIDDSKPNRGVEALPNLEFKFVCGNSLVDTIFGLIIQIGVLANKENVKKLIKEIEQNKSSYFSLSNEKEKVEADLKLLQQKLELAECLISDKADEITHTKAYTEKFIGGDELTKKEAKEKEANEALRKNLELLRKRVNGAHAFLGKTVIKTYQDIDKIKYEYFSQLFVWRIDFAEVFAGKGGFDIVITNPPYIVSKGGRYTGTEFSKEVIDYFRKRYHTAEQQFNTYTLFIELTKSLLSNCGVSYFIVPNTFLANEYSFKLRDFLINKCNVYELFNTGLVFEAASVETVVIGFGNPSSKTIKVRHNEKEYSVLNTLEVTSLTEDKKFLIRINEKTLKLIQKLNKYPKVKTFAKVWRGLTTGNDSKYISNSKDSERHKPLITGSDIEKYGLLLSKQFIDYVPEELDRARDERIFLLDEKLVSKFVGLNLTFAFDAHKHYVLNSACVTELINDSINIKYLLALLNSRVLNFYFMNVFTDYRDTFPIMKSGNIESLPIPEITMSRQQPFISSVDKILAITKSDNYQNNKSKQAEVEKLEEQIDHLVYKLYGLTAAEIAIVEGHSKSD